MTCIICSNMEFVCGFEIVVTLGLVFQYFWIKLFLHIWPSNLILWSEVNIVGLGYLHSHAWSTRLVMVAWMFYIILYYFEPPKCRVYHNYIFYMRRSSLPYLMILYRRITSTDNILQGMVSTYFAVKWPHFIYVFDKFCKL